MQPICRFNLATAETGLHHLPLLKGKAFSVVCPGALPDTGSRGRLHGILHDDGWEKCWERFHHQYKTSSCPPLWAISLLYSHATTKSQVDHRNLRARPPWLHCWLISYGINGDLCFFSGDLFLSSGPPSCCAVFFRLLLHHILVSTTISFLGKANRLKKKTVLWSSSHSRYSFSLQAASGDL